MEAKDWLDFVGELYPEVSKDPRVIEIAKSLPDNYDIQYEFRDAPQFDFWQRWTHDKGITVFPGRAERVNCRLSSPNVGTFDEYLSGKILPMDIVPNGILLYGPLPVLAKINPAMPLVSKIYPQIRAKYRK